MITQVSVNMGAHGTHRPPPTEPGGENLGQIFDRGADILAGEVSGVFESRKQEFNTEMIDFYWQKDGTRMFRFLASCWEDAQ